ncbi:hypothetical protein MAELSTROM_9 [Pseudoalteromonas phage Maelstrom]|uniref:hypothetical protein n=1 Tax=Pseudoalteromonas phage Maelstrom TaxID=2065202 RepID=UPI000CA0F204|nr:hypothetical protein PP584_gp09 [Pseudoalteromonas phage Maelstrom]AUG84929.1 hypothetical protein MAELSTROM_9 [Pseudoalteromonas phage Maelstrom]
MASTQIALTKGIWTQVTTDEVEGSIYHTHGDTRVIYLEAATAPTEFDENTPISGFSQASVELPFYGISASDFIFAYAINGDAKITLTPAAGA